jgi:hypothetical protein
VKPSERILAKVDRGLDETERIREEYGRKPIPREQLWTFGAVEEILKYLDEQAEIEQRRTHVRNALAMVSQFASLQRLNEQLEKAGLRHRVELGESCDVTHDSIVDEAKREGLF